MWKTVKLSDVCKLVYGKALPPEERVENTSFPAFGANGIKTYASKPLYKKPSIIIGRKGSAGELNKVLVPFWALDVTYYVVHDEETINLDYLYHILTLKNLPSLARGVKPGINRNDVYAQEISLPPLPEQQRIVAKVDAAFVEIDKNIDFIKNKEQEINILNEIILSDEFKLSPENKKLNEVCKIFNGGTPDTKNKTYWNGNAQWLTPRDMGKLKNENVIVTLRQLTEAGLKNSSASLIPKNSIILSCRAPIGHLAINNVPMAFNQGCKGLVPDSTILQYKYLYYFLFSSKKLLNNLGTGTTFKEISSKVLSSVKINVPSLDRQKKIINKLDLIFKELQKLKDINKKQIENYSNLKKILLNKELISKAA